MNRACSFFPFAILLAIGIGNARSEDAPLLELAAPFTDNAILQRESEVPVWGWAKPGTRITVSFAEQKKAVEADSSGAWMVKLDSLEASRDARDLIVESGEGETITLSGILVGEVWFSSGQSNMVWTAGQSMCRDLAKELSDSRGEIPIREININTVSALYPQKRATSDQGWKTSQDAGGFSALSLSFAHSLYQELNIPIGILLSAHSNTRIEAFTSREAIEAHPNLKGDTDLMHDADPLTEQGRKAYAQYYHDLAAWQNKAGRLAEEGGKIPSRPSLPGIAGMWRGPSQFFNGKINPVVPYAIRGAIWCQGTSNSNDGRIYSARMEALVSGWREAWDMPEMPFYFTQMQCYGSPDPESVGFADIRQVQHRFFVNNRKNIGMVVQSDLNSARPQGIHYFNKLHPGMRMARWALAKQYGKDIAYTGPIYSGYEVEGDTVIVSFEKESLFGGLMVGNKGMAADYKKPGKFVEPAQPTPDEKLNHFRLCDEDRKWHPAEATIVGDSVHVRAKAAPNPIGVQYAYSAVPENSNLYNEAGLPATPFAAINGELIFEEDDLEKAATLKAKYAEYTDPNYPLLQVAEYYRDGAILQRNHPISVWGHANAGETVTVILDSEKLSARANDLQQWSVTFPPRQASSDPVTMRVESTHGFSRTVSDILIGDVWYLTGSTLLTSEWAYNRRDEQAEIPVAMPLVREFRRRTAASTFATPRKRRFETGGGKYRTAWATADFSIEEEGVTMFAYEFAKALSREGIPQGFITMSSGRGGRSRQLSSPLSWTSFHGVRNDRNPAFRDRLNELFLQYPNSKVARDAVEGHVNEVKAFVDGIMESGGPGADLSRLPLQAPAFPEAGKSETVASDTIPTYTYNWCVSPLTPMGIAGVLWVPSEYNLSEDSAHYAAELEIYARSLPGTYGQETVSFFYAQPDSSLVQGITKPEIPGAKSVNFQEWPKSLKELATAMAELVE